MIKNEFTPLCLHDTSACHTHVPTQQLSAISSAAFEWNRHVIAALFGVESWESIFLCFFAVRAVSKMQSNKMCTRFRSSDHLWLFDRFAQNHLGTNICTITPLVFTNLYFKISKLFPQLFLELQTFIIWIKSSSRCNKYFRSVHWKKFICKRRYYLYQKDEHCGRQHFQSSNKANTNIGRATQGLKLIAQ